MICKECEEKEKRFEKPDIVSHIRTEHNMTAEEYKNKYNERYLVDEDLTYKLRQTHLCKAYKWKAFVVKISKGGYDVSNW